MTTPTDTGSLLPLLEENLELSRETHAKVNGIEVQLRSVAGTVEKHDVSLYHADEGGIIGRVGRIEDRLNARIDSIQKDAVAAIAAVRAEIAPMRWVGLIVGGAVIMWLVTQGLTLIKP